MANITSIGGNPIVPAAVQSDTITDAMLKQTGGVLDTVGSISRAASGNTQAVFDVQAEYAIGSNQLFDYRKAVHKGWYGSTGIWNPNDSLLGAYVPVEQGKSYTISGGITSWNAFLTRDMEWIVSNVQVSSGTTLTAPEGASYLYVSTSAPGIKNVVVNEGSTAAPYDDYFINVERLGNGNMPYQSGYIYRQFDVQDSKEPNEQGENIFDTSQTMNQGYFYNYASGNKGNDASYYTTDFLDVEQGSYFIKGFNGHICLWDSEQKYVTGYLCLNANGGVVFSTPEKAEYITLSISGAASVATTRMYKLDGNNVNTAYLKLPASYRPYGKPTKLCMLVHGASMGISSDGSSGWTYNSTYNKLVSALIDSGYAVIDSNGYDDSNAAGHEHWGCPQAISGYYKAYDYFTRNYNLEKQVYVYGFSMGGLTALTMGIEQTLPIKCMMVGAPVISIQDQAGTNPYMLQAYGISSYSADGVRGFDRYLDIVAIDSIEYVLNNLPPLYIAYGSSDTAISNANILKYYAALRNANQVAFIKEFAGGHEISYGGNLDEVASIVEWFSRY